MVIEVFCLGLPVVSCLSTPSRRRWKIFAIFHHADADVDVVMGVVWCGVVILWVRMWKTVNLPKYPLR